MRASASGMKSHDWAFARTHAAHGEGAGDESVAEGEEVRVAGLKQADHHVPGDAHLMGVLGAKDACKAAREAMVGEVPRDRRGEMSLAVS